jgi:parallel beta-helix repeat protein
MNQDGIVLVNSDGKVVENSIKNNLRAGILTASKTTTLIDANVIEDNLVSGVVIKDPSMPILRRNQIQKNFY